MSFIKSELIVKFAPKNVKFKSQSKVKVGEAIKQLNKENKSLFGELLESKRQKLNRNINPSYLASNFENRNTEIEWGLKKSPSNQIKINYAMHRAKDVVSELKFNSAPQPQEDIEDILPKCPPNVNADSGLVKDTGSYSNRKPLLQLPEIIVRNIPTFPLFRGKGPNLPKSQLLEEDSLQFCDAHILPSVTKILSSTMSEASRVALRRWKQKMIADLGEEGFMEFYKAQLNEGSNFHSLLRSYLSGVPESELSFDYPSIEGCWQSLMKSVLPYIDDTLFIETEVVHPKLMYHGFIDCVARYRGKIVLIEWKKSKKPKSEIGMTYDGPLQMCAYLGALSFDSKYIQHKIKGALLVVAYNDGSPANCFHLTLSECQHYWTLWLKRLQQYWLRQEEITGAQSSANFIKT